MLTFDDVTSSKIQQHKSHSETGEKLTEQWKRSCVLIPETRTDLSYKNLIVFILEYLIQECILHFLSVVNVPSEQCFSTLGSHLHMGS